MISLPEFETERLADAIEALTPADLDRLPFGVIGLDAEGTVRVYNRTEAQQSGRKARPTQGRQFFVDIAPCMNNPSFKGRIDRALAAGTLDIAFSFVGDFSDRDRALTVRVQAATDGGSWMFIQRQAADTGA